MIDLLILIGTDPARDTRAAEAVRIAAGVGAWRKVRVSVYLHGPALACLSDFVEELEGGPVLAQYLPMIAAHGGLLYVERGNPRLREARPELAVIPLSLDELHEVLGQTDYSMNFGEPPPLGDSVRSWPANTADDAALLADILRPGALHLW